MEKKHFMVRLIPPRPTFPWDITPEEAALMNQHADYLQRQFEAGALIAYGPVLKPEHAYGMAIFEAHDEAEVRAVMNDDPTVKAGLNGFDVFPMRVSNARAKTQKQ